MKRTITLLTIVHRYLGIVFCLIFVVWFASGIVMVYARMPQYDTAERLARLAPLDPQAIRLSDDLYLNLVKVTGALKRGRTSHHFFI